jgi:hypothetical protein
MSLHRAHTLEVGLGVQAQPALGPLRVQQLVPALPCTQALSADTGAPAELADAENACLEHAETIQNIYRIWTGVWPPSKWVDSNLP